MDQDTINKLQAEAHQNQLMSQQMAALQNGSPLAQDVRMFLDMFPILLSGCLQKSANVNDAISSAMEGARTALGQYVQMGLCQATTRLPDGSPLARLPNGGYATSGVPMPINQPGGGMVSPGNYVGQAPTVASQPVRVT